MIKIERHEQLILVDRAKGREVTFKNEKELKEYVLKLHEVSWIYITHGYNNIILDSLDVTGKDVGYYIDVNVRRLSSDREKWGTKPYIVYDAYGRIVDIRRYFNKGLKPVVGVSWNQKKYLKEKDSGYRKEPVSHTGVRHKYYHYNRRINYKSVLTKLTIPEYKEYTSPKELKRFNDIYIYETLRHVEKSWKSQYKCRKQWMIHSKEKTKGRRNKVGLEELNMDTLLAEDFEMVA